MRKFLLTILVATSATIALAQGDAIRSMSWGKDYKLHVRLGNDSSYVMDVRGLYHQGESALHGTGNNTTTYLPVALDKEFVRLITAQPLSDSLRATTDTTGRKSRNTSTLWSALHEEIGGGYVHLINCIIYALESGQLHLQHIAMKRPETAWKPNPMTETYRRTRKWKYYTPTTQKEAHKEYKKRKGENELRDLEGIPQRFIDLFVQTSDRQYRTLVHEGRKDRVAQIDLVRMMLGAKYLGNAQIEYVSHCVHTAIARYDASNLPSVIIFDDYDAAVAMRLDSSGYQIDYIVFQNQSSLAQQEVANRETRIRSLVQNINTANDRLFRRRLSKYYE